MCPHALNSSVHLFALSCHLSVSFHFDPLIPVVVAGAPGVSGVSPWAQSEDDGGEKTSPVPGGGFQWGGSPQGPQVSVWAPQGSGWEGGIKYFPAGP